MKLILKIIIFFLFFINPSNETNSQIVFNQDNKMALLTSKLSGYEKHTNWMGQNSYNYEYIKNKKFARRGEHYQRFELRNGDCFGNEGWNDCENDRERVEFSSYPRQQPTGQECFAYSIMLDDNFVDIHPTNTDLGQIHQEGGPKGEAGGMSSLPPLIQIGAKRGKLNFGWHELTGSSDNVIDKKREYPLIKLKHMKGKWTDISFCLDYENKRMDIWINGLKVQEIKKSPINFVPKETYFKFGIYRSFISRYKQSETLEKLPTQIVYYDEIRRGNSIEEVDYNLNPDLKPVD